jgi:hypothetical protein
MSRNRFVSSAALVVSGLALAGALLPAAHSIAQRSPLLTGGSASNFGALTLSGGFTPDPTMREVRSGGTIDVGPLSLAPGCTGFVTAQPDIVLHYDSPAEWVRFFVRSAGDTTLVINDGAGHWHCDDDSGGGTNPMVDLPHPASGQYDIWIGSYASSSDRHAAQLGITELHNVRP